MSIALNVGKLRIAGNISTLCKKLSTNVASKLIYFEYGDPIKVIHVEQENLSEPKEQEVLVKMLAAPVNPADINTIQGKYPSKPQLPAVPGNEGVGIVEKVGSDVVDITEGDHVVPLTNNLGTWRTHILLNSDKVFKVPKELGLVEAATLTVNPCTAYRMLRDFAVLKPGDTVIQNGANSACGQNVIQICKSWGIRTINVVRNRPEINELKTFLKNLGGTYVFTEDELRTTDIFRNHQIEKPKLALNCVGGKSALDIMRYLQNSSPIVTYGGMSREPVTIPTSALIFKDIQVRGFWMTKWTQNMGDSVERIEMFKELISMMTSNDLHGPSHQMVKFKDYSEALMNTLTINGMTGKKFILDFTS
ncbi:enoyl-[acyl-carrier-protein] reductase, mitochondrial [Diorhabda sublineata]|uniref:enoyl-[acyl-carrier-protein] reductase, mitochondrial n=1 Tax=Diorhabda sublineata TaxID=1163346 RepID=UPI0024E192EA|nr:enoyl-[acyl-carrier-protein] reductase, mitochondrial [Diorhabda sublineata]